MTDSRAAVGMDRLPWLADEPKPQPASRAPELLVWIVAAIVMVASAAYWLGLKSADRDVPSAPRASPASSTTTTVPLPQPRALEPAQPQVEPQRLPEVAPVVPRPAPRVRELAREAPVAKPAMPAPAVSDTPAEVTDAPVGETAKKPVERKVDPLTPWPVRVPDGASGRLVRVGTFTTARQAKKGWWAIVRNNPSLKRLPALVVPAQSLRNGRVFYRLQMGTTSQAHSEVLCQRMRIIGQSCVVIEVYNRGQEVAG